MQVQKHEPIFNVHVVVLALIGVCVAVHIVRSLLPIEDNAWVTAVLAFIPARYSDMVRDLPGGMPARFTSFITHLFVHGDVTHLMVNSAWLLAFGTPVARRTDPLRFLVLFFLCGIAGAALYLAINGPVVTLLIGASGAISGLMGAAFRFIFASLSEGPAGFANASRYLPLASLRETLHDRRVVTSVVIWSVLNLMLAWGAPGLTDVGGIAWEAHLGGFFAGFLLYGWFDNPPAAPVMPEPEEAWPDGGDAHA